MRIVGCNRYCTSGNIVQCMVIRCLKASRTRELKVDTGLIKRRDVVGMVLGVTSIFVGSIDAKGAGLPPEEKPKLCDNSCEKELENVW